MKKLILILAVLGFGVGGAIAGCGAKITNTGELKSYDADAKAIVVIEGDEEVKIEITEDTTIPENLSEMVGENVKVISEHGKADSVEAAAS